jgi:hypothetical protein
MKDATEATALVGDNSPAKRDKWLYLVAGKRNITNGKVRYANVGEAFDVEARLKNPDYARKRAGGNWQLLCKWNIGQHRDHNVHPLLKKRGLVFDPDNTDNTEEVAFNMSIEDAVDLVGQCVNELLHGVSRRASYAMRPEQAACRDKAVAYFQGGGDRFLVDAKMRFGKTHVSYQIARGIEAQRVLILTYKPAVEDSWREDLEGHVDFARWEFRLVEEGDQGPGVYFSSMQGIISDERSEAERRRWLYEQDWDLVVFDEEHYGSRSDRAMAIRKELEPRTKRWLFLSGTPFQARLSGEFSNDQVFTWSYIDEQRAKKSWTGPSNPYAPLPDMSFHTYDFSDLVKASNGKLYSKDEQFRMDKLFAATEKSFKNPGAVGEFLDLVGGTSMEARQNQVSPWHSCKIDKDMLDHTLWILPSVAACEAMADQLRSHRKFRDFAVINVAGDNETHLSAVRNTIACKEKTITLSCGRFTTGVTVPPWGAVFFLADGRSPMGYYQAAFRCQSPWKMAVDAGGNVLQWKEKCYVIDFSPHRLLEMVYVSQAAARDKEREDISQSIASYLECAPIYRYGEVRPVELAAEDVLKVAIKPHNLVDRFAASFSIDIGKADPDIISALMGVAPAYAQSIHKVVTDTGVERGKVKEATARAQHRKQEKEAKRKQAYLRERAQSVLRSLPSYLFVTEQDERSYLDIFLRGDHGVFKEETGVTIDQFRHMIETGFLDRDHLDNCIISFNMLKKSIPKMTEVN